ncbi:MAG: serine/threonine-protein phosphatase [Dehalococcoidia bacterium]|nr:serine/threonine-protein phosphatase [Dehalococcoidia bacterium]
MELFAVAERGIVRPSNEDAALARREGERCILVVADGMGGGPAGEVASEHVIRAFEVPSGSYDPATYLYGRCADASIAIAAEVLLNPDMKGMASTVAAAVVEGDEVWTGHIGDSRVYLWDDAEPEGQRLRCLTRDHTLGQEALDAGTALPPAARGNLRSRTLTRVLGSSRPECSISGPQLLSPSACVLVVTDGVTGVISDEAIAHILASCRGADLAGAVREAVMALGAPDNFAYAVLDRRELC